MNKIINFESQKKNSQWLKKIAQNAPTPEQIAELARANILEMDFQ
jgi:hypothetical protein